MYNLLRWISEFVSSLLLAAWCHPCRGGGWWLFHFGTSSHSVTIRPMGSRPMKNICDNNALFSYLLHLMLTCSTSYIDPVTFTLQYWYGTFRWGGSMNQYTMTDIENKMHVLVWLQLQTPEDKLIYLKKWVQSRYTEYRVVEILGFDAIGLFLTWW